MSEHEAGDVLAGLDLAAAYRSHRSDLLGFLVRRLRNHATAEDLVQEAYVRLSEAASSVRHARPFLFQVAANLLRDHMRAEKRRLSRATIDALLQLPADELTPERRLLGAEELHRMTVAVAELPPRCREVFELSRQGGLSSRQIATKLGISTAAVEKSMRRAFTHLSSAAKNSNHGVRKTRS